MDAIANALGLMRPSGKELFNAAANGKTEEVRRLLAQKAPLEYKNVRHRHYRKSTTHRPAHALSLSCGKRRCGEGLRGGGARARAARSLSRYRRLSLARRPSRSLSRRAPLSRTNACTRLLRQFYGDTPLRIAAMSGHDAVVRLLLEAGADKEAKANDGKTALDKAREKGHTSIVALLGGSAADKEAAEKVAAERAGYELYNAAEAGKTEDVRRLLAKKAPLEYKRGVRHRPYRKSTTHRPAHALSLCVAKGGAERA